MILELDVGNSRVKWRLRSPVMGSELPGHTTLEEHSQVCSHNAVIERHDSLLAELQGVEQILASSVVDTLKGPVQELAKHLNVPLQRAATTAQCAGVKNSYAEPARMGVDRWLAMIAAFNQGGSTTQGTREAICVIDSGTSLTVDFVAANGQHEGGLILPGRSLLLSSLSRNTEKVLFDPSSDQGELALGVSTDQAVFNGAEHMLLGAIQQAIVSASATAGSARRFYLTGGDGPRLLAGFQQRLGLEGSVVPDLVLDGLQLALP